MRKRLEYHGASSGKFWEVEVTGSTVKVRYGRTGTAGRVLVKECDSPSAARVSAKKQIVAKRRKAMCL